MKGTEKMCLSERSDDENEIFNISGVWGRKFTSYLRLKAIK
jgi:hypothetical protein